MKRINYKNIAMLIIAIVVIIMFSISLRACGSSKIVERETVTVTGSGKLTYTFVEDFTEDYYSKSELNRFIKNDIKEFNKRSGKKKVKAQKPTVSDGKVYLTMTFPDSATFSEYNNIRIFQGSVMEGKSDGYLFDGEFKTADKGTVVEGPNIYSLDFENPEKLDCLIPR